MLLPQYYLNITCRKVVTFYYFKFTVADMSHSNAVLELFQVSFKFECVATKFYTPQRYKLSYQVVVRLFISLILLLISPLIQKNFIAR